MNRQSPSFWIVLSGTAAAMANRRPATASASSASTTATTSTTTSAMATAPALVSEAKVNSLKAAVNESIANMKKRKEIEAQVRKLKRQKAELEAEAHTQRQNLEDLRARQSSLLSQAVLPDGAGDDTTTMSSQVPLLFFHLKNKKQKNKKCVLSNFLDFFFLFSDPYHT
jgi:hypothetical protein